MSVSPGRVGVPIPVCPPPCLQLSVPRAPSASCSRPLPMSKPLWCPCPSMSTPPASPPVSRRVRVRPLVSESLRDHLLTSLSVCPPSCPCVPLVSVSMDAQHVSTPLCPRCHIRVPLCPSCPSMSILSNPCLSTTILSPFSRVTAPLSPPPRVRVHPVTSVSLCVPRVPQCPPSHVHPFMSVSSPSCPCPPFRVRVPPRPSPRVRVHPATRPPPVSPMSVSTPSCPSVTTAPVSPRVTAPLTHPLVSTIPRVPPSLDAHPPRVLAPPCPLPGARPPCPCPLLASVSPRPPRPPPRIRAHPVTPTSLCAPSVPPLSTLDPSRPLLASPSPHL